MANKKKFFKVNSASGLNLRREPTKASDVLKVFQYGERVEIDSSVETPEGWAAVKDGGFVMKKYID